MEGREGLGRGFSRGDDMRTSGPALRLMSDKRNVLRGVPWSHPSRGITGDLGPSHNLNLLGVGALAC